MRLLKSIYQLLPFKKHVFGFLKAVYIPPHSIYKHLHFKGVIKVKIDNGRQFLMHHYGYEIENEIFWNGLKDGWEKQSTNLWIKLCEDAHTIIDIGANTGIYSLMAKAINPQAHVIALEPVKRVYDKLVQNIQLNNYDIACIPEAASNKDGEAIIFDIPNTEHTYSVTVNTNIYSPGTPVIQTIIQTIKLDTFIERENISQVDLLKIDVETHEPEVIEGYLKYIYLHKPTILIEILNDEVGERIEKMVAGLGYLYFNIDENAGIKKVDKITKSDYYNYLLCDHDKAVKLNLIKN